MFIVRLLISWYMHQNMQVKWGTNFSSPVTVTIATSSWHCTECAIHHEQDVHEV